MSDATVFQQKYRLFGLQPVLYVRSIPETLAFYSEKLGFRVDWTWGDPANRARVSYGDQGSDSGIVIQFHHWEGPKPIGSAAYLYLYIERNLDALCAEYRARGVTITEEAESKSWHMREFAIVDPNGHELRFGQSIEPDPEG